MARSHSKFRALSPFALAALLGIGLHGATLAQGPRGPETVVWSVAPAAGPVKAGSKSVVTLRGTVTPGWHVYGYKQLPTGPTSLQVTVDENTVAKADGAPGGTPPQKVLDRAFKVVTPYYDKDFTVTAPVKIGAKVAPGPRTIPVSVRFQTCNNEVCQPPKTVRLSVPVTVGG